METEESSGGGERFPRNGFSESISGSTPPLPKPLSNGGGVSKESRHRASQLLFSFPKTVRPHKRPIHVTVVAHPAFTPIKVVGFCTAGPEKHVALHHRAAGTTVMP